MRHWQCATLRFFCCHSLTTGLTCQETPLSLPNIFPCPQFAAITLIVGDSIAKNNFKAHLHCFPGATISVILSKFQELRSSLPSTTYLSVSSCPIVSLLRPLTPIRKAERSHLRAWFSNGFSLLQGSFPFQHHLCLLMWIVTVSHS